MSPNAISLDAPERDSLLLCFLATAVRVSGLASAIVAAFALTGALIFSAFAIYRKYTHRHTKRNKGNK